MLSYLAKAKWLNDVSACKEFDEKPTCSFGSLLRSQYLVIRWASLVLKELHFWAAELKLED